MRRDTLYLALSLVWLAILITVIFFCHEHVGRQPRKPCWFGNDARLFA
jgi:hypothetical protein